MRKGTHDPGAVDRPSATSPLARPRSGDRRQPLVSIVIPAYDSRRWVCEAIDSALGQTYPSCEVLVIDDGSTDGTGELIDRRYGSDVTCQAQPNRGLAAARNKGLSIARGEYVQFLDADDLLRPDKIAVQVAALEERAEHSVAYCDFAYFDAERPERTWSAGFERRYRSGDVFADLLRMNFIVCHAALARTADVREVGGFDEDLASCQDYDLWLRLAGRGRRFIFTPGVMALYRQTPDSMSTDWAREFASTVAVLDKVPRYAVLDRRTRRIRGMHRMLSAGLASLARLNAKLGILSRPPRQRRVVRFLQSVRARLRSSARSDGGSR